MANKQNTVLVSEQLYKFPGLALSEFEDYGAGYESADDEEKKEEEKDEDDEDEDDDEEEDEESDDFE